jgi:hypothetical protein
MGAPKIRSASFKFFLLLWIRSDRAVGGMAFRIGYALQVGLSHFVSFVVPVVHRLCACRADSGGFCALREGLGFGTLV